MRFTIYSPFKSRLAHQLHLLKKKFPLLYFDPLNRIDDEIFEDLSAKFPELVTEPYETLIKLDEDWMKSADGKKRWREFIEQYKDKVKDYNFGSLIRTDCRDEYGERNTIFG